MVKRVVILQNFIPPYKTPLYKALEERLEDVRILISTPMEPNRPWPAEWKGLRVRVQRTLTFRRAWKHPQGFTDTLFVHVPIDTFWLLWNHRPDVVISNEMGARTVQAAIYRLLNPKCRLIIEADISEHTEEGRGRVREGLRRWLLPKADAVLVHGESGARYVRRFGVNDRRIFRAPYSTDVRSFETSQTTSSPKGTHRLLYVGQLTERKGILPFLKVFLRWAREHPERKVELRFVGDGPLRPTLKSMQTATVSLSFLGAVSYERLPDIYAWADILVFPTLADVWGVVVNEAMAAGVPVLGSMYSQAVEELIEDGVSGWTFRPDHPSEILNALDCALQTSPDALQAMKMAARSKSLDLTPDKMADRYVKVVSFVSESSSGI